MRVRLFFLLFAAASVLALLRAGASQTGVVFTPIWFFGYESFNRLVHLDNKAGGISLARVVTVEGATVRAQSGIAADKPAQSADEYFECLFRGLPDKRIGCLCDHSTTLAQPAPGAERSEHRTRQQRKSSVAAVFS